MKFDEMFPNNGFVRHTENPFCQMFWYGPQARESFVTTMASKAGRCVVRAYCELIQLRNL